MTTIYPSINELKEQAKRLRQAMAARGGDVAHSAALELLAKQYGLRDWNTLSVLAAKPNAVPSAPVAVGTAVRGRYLNQPFTGKVLALSEQSGGLYRITIHFDAPVDVVTFESFGLPPAHQRPDRRQRHFTAQDFRWRAASGAGHLASILSSIDCGRHLAVRDAAWILP